MIVTKIIGGLGNQMFQWACGRSLSLQYGKPVFVDINGYKNQDGLTKREFQLSLFENLKNIDFSSHYEIYKDKYFYGIHDYFNFKKSVSEFQLLSSGNIFLDGYWQSEKYFANYADEIRNDFACFDDSLKSLIEPNSVSVHVRRTDYLSSNGYHPVQPISYFQSGIDAIGDYNKMYVFSDDISWCKTNLNFKNMVFMEGRSGLEDMHLMSFCSNNIISNSSFSWWAAWLNKNPNKRVVAPNNWFGINANLNTEDIIPDRWLKI